MKKRMVSCLLATVLIGSTLLLNNKVYALTVDELYANAYNATAHAKSTGAQKDVNIARQAIEALRGTGAEFAIGEFSKQVDTVQHPILVKFVSAYNEAASALAHAQANPSIVNKDESNGTISVQKRIEAARESLDQDMPAVWRSSYSSGLDIVQQNYQNLIMTCAQNFKYKGDGSGLDQAMRISDDIYYNATNPALQLWADSMYWKLVYKYF